MNDVRNVIGIIDSYGAIHYKKIKNVSDEYHETLWPGKNKRWRFDVEDWNLEKSILSCEAFSLEEEDAILALMRKICTPPKWFLRGEIWEKYGRPHKGAKYEKYLRELKKKGLQDC